MRKYPITRQATPADAGGRGSGGDLRPRPALPVGTPAARQRFIDRAASTRQTTLLLAPGGTVETMRDLEGVFVEQLFKAMRETVPDGGLVDGGSDVLLEVTAVNPDSVTVIREMRDREH